MSHDRFSTLDVSRRRGPLTETLWREWCFARVALRHFRVRFLVMLTILLGGAFLFLRFEPDKHLSLPEAIYYSWSLVFGEAPEAFPRSRVLQVLFFVIPVLGLTVIVEGIVDFALTLRDRRRHERSWCQMMAATSSNHIVLVGLGKLGFRIFKLLRRLGEPVVVIERDADNEFLEEVRRDGAPLLIGDARREAMLTDANLRAARSLILATDDDLANLEIALDARQMAPGVRVVLRMFDQNMADKIRSGFDIHLAMSQSALSAPTFAIAALQSSFLSSSIVGDRIIVMQRWTARPGGPLVGRALSELMETYRFGIVELRREGKGPSLFPSPSQCVQSGDVLLVQGEFDDMVRLSREMGVEADDRSGLSRPTPP